MGLIAAALALLLTACAGVDPMTPGPETSVPAKAFNPLSYVAPELRPVAEQLLQQQAGIGAIGAQNLPTFRKGFSAASREAFAAPEVQEFQVPVGGAPDVTVYVIGAQAGATKPAILHMHGGGYVLGSAQSGLRELQELSIRHRSVVVSVEYRLAPETPFPGALEDNYAALQWVHDNSDELGVDPSLIMLMGESAGGGHAAMLAIAARDRGELPIHKQILIYPMLDDRTGSTFSVQPWVGRYAWSAESNRFGWSSLLGRPAGSEEVPAGSVPARVSDLRGLPPTFIAVGSIDLFADEDIVFARRLLDAGVATELLVIPGAFHGFDFFAADTSLARQFRRAIDDAIGRDLPAISAEPIAAPTGSPKAAAEQSDLAPRERGVISF